MDRRLSWLPIISGALVLTFSVAITVWTVTRPESVSRFNAEAQLSQKTVSVFPQKANLSKSSNEDLSVAVLFESGKMVADKIDVVVGFDPIMAQASLLTQGMIFDSYPTVNIDNTRGTIRIVAENKTARAVNGILASFKLKVKGKGVVLLDFKQAIGAEKTNGAQYLVN